MVTLKLLVRRDSTYIPNFIDTRLKEHYQSYTLMSGNIWTSILTCCNKKFYSELDIDLLASGMFDVINEIRYISTDELYYLVYKYMIKKLKEYQSYANDVEEYEAAQNLKMLLISLSNIKNIPIDE